MNKGEAALLIMIGSQQQVLLEEVRAKHLGMDREDLHREECLKEVKIYKSNRRELKMQFDQTLELRAAKVVQPSTWEGQGPDRLK